MTEELVIYHCSPTMAGMKTGNLFTCPKEETNVLTENIRKLKLPPCSKRDQAASSKKNGKQDIAVYVPSGEAGRRFQEP